MKLVGATKWYIMRPLLASALKQGFVAGAVASLMICATAYVIKGVMPAGIAILGYGWVGIIVGTVVLLGIVITIGFSAMAINKFINMRSNNIHLY
jgi:cell division transport system permease protein